MFNWVKDELKSFGNYVRSEKDLFNLSSDPIDLALIGSGLSSTYTLIEFLNQIKSNNLCKNRNSPIKIIMFEKDSWLWGGIPYGQRSGFTTLIITPLDEFLPEDELFPFIEWMSMNIDWLIVPFKERAGTRSRKWLEESLPKIVSKDSSKIHVPRYFFGIYLWEKLKLAAENKNLKIKLDFINADVRAIENNNISQYSIHIDKKIIFKASKVLLGVGIPKIRSLTSKKDQPKNLILLNDPYVPDLQSSIDLIADILKTKSQKKILIVGANASALEIIYQITNIKKFDEFDVKISVLSPQGKLPDLYIKDKHTNFVANNLTKLSNSKDLVTADSILNALKDDLFFADNNDYKISDTLPIFTKNVGSLVNKLSKKEKYKFISYHGVEIGRLQRRAGYEYTQPVKELTNAGKLNIIKGKFNQFKNYKKFTAVEYIKDNRKNFEEESFDIVINCAGSAGLVNRGKSPLITQLINSGLCKPTPSNHGLCVGNKFDALPGFYINGPLLAGNVVGDMGIWHVEHCGRIISFAKRIASDIAKELSH